MDKRIEPRGTADKSPSDKDGDKPDHGIITAGPDAHEREKPGYTPPADRAGNKSGKTGDK